jgi:iron complex outermembrane receptor protein
MRKGVLLLFGLLLVVFTGFAKKAPEAGGGITGKITTADGRPAADVSVSIKQKNIGTLTDNEGNFSFKHLPDGTYDVEVSLTGYAVVHQSVTVANNKAGFVAIQLTVSEKQLDAVTITTGYNKFNKKETDDVARLPLKNMENPQVYTIVTKEIMQEQLITDYNSAFKNIPGAGVPLVYNQGRSAMLSRGFTTANLVRNSVSGFVYTNIDPANLERLEAIKGPSGTLFNSSMISFGGLFNRITKKPFTEKRNEVSYTAAGFDLNRLTVDVNKPLTEDKTVLLRINGAVHSEQSFQDAGFTRSYMVAPSLAWKASDKLSFLLDVEASSFNATSPIRFAPSSTGKIHDIKSLGIDYKKSFTSNTLAYTTQQLNVFGQINYELAPQWKLQTNFTRTYSATKGYVTQLIGKSDSTLQQSAQKENFPYNGTDIQQNLIGDLHLAGLRNRIVVGVEYYNQKSSRNTPTVTLPAINFKHPGAAYNNFNADKVDSAAARAVYSTYQTNQSTYSIYVSDVLNITSRLNVMLSLRSDRFVDEGTRYPAYDSVAGAYSQNALSPKLGMVYEVVKNTVSVFANYMNGFSNTGGTDYNGNSFKPQQANQWEGGVKIDAFKHRVSATLSYYNIDVTNITRDDPDHAGYSLQDGTQVSKGFEAEVIANPFAGFNIIAGYSYNDSKYTKANKSVNGLRPASAGPANLANLWASYKWVGGKAKGLGVGIGGNYGSSAYQSNTSTFVFTIPQYLVLDATLFYDQPSYRIGIKVDNLTNQQYWSFRLAPQNPTRLSANITFRF